MAEEYYVDLTQIIEILKRGLQGFIQESVQKQIQEKITLDIALSESFRKFVYEEVESCIAKLAISKQHNLIVNRSNPDIVIPDVKDLCDVNVGYETKGEDSSAEPVSNECSLNEGILTESEQNVNASFHLLFCNYFRIIDGFKNNTITFFHAFPPLHFPKN